MNSTGHMHGDMGNSTMDPNMDMGDHEGMDHSMMHMWFYFGVENVPILFKAWTVNSGGEMAGACVGVFILAMLYEGLKVLREILLKRSFIQTRRKEVQTTDSSNALPLMDQSPSASQQSISSTMWSPWHFLQTLLHLIQVFISYALMLIFMTYNGYLAISIVVGAGVGYFAFGWKKAVIVDINEHCH